MRRSTFGLVLATDAVALWLFHPQWAQLIALITGPMDFLQRNGADRTVAVAALAAVWAIGLWLGLGLAATVAAALPGSLGRLGAHLATAVLPRALLRLAAATTGLAVLAAPVAAMATTSADRAPSTVAAGSVTDSRIVHHPGSGRAVSPIPTPPSLGGVAPASWPTDLPTHTSSATASGSPTTTPASTTPASTTPATTTPATTTPSGLTPIFPTTTTTASGAAPTVPAPSPPMTSTPLTPTYPPTPGAAPGSAPGSAPVKVRAGDCLWLIAARRLGPTATPAEIAASWPAWYAANHAVIGADPRLVRPGELLVAPHAAAPHAAAPHAAAPSTAASHALDLHALDTRALDPHRPTKGWTP